MNGSSFSILRAVRNAYAFVGREWKYLLRLSLLPMGVSGASQLFLFYQSIDVAAGGRIITTFESYAWNLPATLLLGWFMFHETRLLLLGERGEALPANAEYLALRRVSMKISILIWALFNMGWSGLLGYHEWMAGVQLQDQSFWPVGLGAVLVGAFFWSLRFSVAHILAAVDYPVRQYVRQVDGLGISLRLAGMWLLASIPVLMGFILLAEILVPDVKSINDPSLGVVVALGGPLSLLVAAILNAAGGFALREMLQNNSTPAGQAP